MFSKVSKMQKMSGKMHKKYKMKLCKTDKMPCDIKR